MCPGGCGTTLEQPYRLSHCHHLLCNDCLTQSTECRECDAPIDRLNVAPATFATTPVATRFKKGAKQSMPQKKKSKHDKHVQRYAAPTIRGSKFFAVLGKLLELFIKAEPAPGSSSAASASSSSSSSSASSASSSADADPEIDRTEYEGDDSDEKLPPAKPPIKALVFSSFKDLRDALAIDLKAGRPHVEIFEGAVRDPLRV